MIGRRRREKARSSKLHNTDAVTVDVEPTLRRLERTVHHYDRVRDRYLRIVKTQTGR